MNKHQVTCITKSSPNGSHEHITHIGGSHWSLTKKAAISRIESKTEGFYVIDQRTGKVSDVGVVHPTHGDPYLRTHADGDWNNNLLSLNACPVGAALIA